MSRMFGAYRGHPFVWGDSGQLMRTHPDFMARCGVYIKAHRLMLEIEYNPAATEELKREAIQVIVNAIKYMSESGATMRAAGLRQAQMRRTNPPQCYLCRSRDDAICDDCCVVDDGLRWMIVCKKIGNVLSEQLVKSKSDAVNALYQQTKEIRERRAQIEMRRAHLANLNSHLDAAKRHNEDKKKRIEALRARIEATRVQRKELKLATEKQHAQLVELQTSSIPSAKSSLEERRAAISDARPRLLSDLHLLHWIELHDAKPSDLAGHPRMAVRLPPSRSLSGGPSTSPSPAAVAPSKKPANAPPASWHFLHTAVGTTGPLLRSLPQPTTTLIPLITFMHHIARWWYCALPYPLQPLPTPLLYCPSLEPPSALAAASQLPHGWHKIPLVTASYASEYDLKVHAMLADNARAIMRAVGTFPEEAIDFSDQAWLNAFFFTFLHSYIKAQFGQAPNTPSTPIPAPPGTPSPSLAHSVFTPSHSISMSPISDHTPHIIHRPRAISRSGIPFSSPASAPPTPTPTADPSTSGLSSPDTGASPLDNFGFTPVPIPPPNHTGWRSYLF